MFHLIIIVIAQGAVLGQYAPQQRYPVFQQQEQRFQPYQQQEQRFQPYQQQEQQQQFQPYQQQEQRQQQQRKQHPNIIPIKAFDSYDKDGTRNFGFQTADGQQRVEQMGADGTVRGSYSYMGPDGKQVKINYVADKNGFHASGPTIPTPPPAAAAAAPKPQRQEPPSYSGFQETQRNDDYNDNGQDYDDGGGGGGRGNYDRFSPSEEQGRAGFQTQNFQQRAPAFGGGENNDDRQSQFRGYDGDESRLDRQQADYNQENADTPRNRDNQQRFNFF